MRKYLILHFLIISLVFILTPTIQAASDMEDEIESYKQAIRIKPDDADAHYNLCVAYASLNDKASALEQYKILKSLDSTLAKKAEHEVAKEARKAEHEAAKDAKKAEREVAKEAKKAKRKAEREAKKAAKNIN